MKIANPVSRLVGMVGALLVLGVLPACGKADSVEKTEPKTALDWFDIKMGELTVRTQLVVTTPEMQRGLMGRRDLETGQGMLFVYAQPQQVSFWMRNTPTALDIGYISGDGVLREIYPLHPFDENSVPSRRDDIQFALEVKQGWFEFVNIKPGDQLDLEAVKAALEARGFDPLRFANFEN